MQDTPQSVPTGAGANAPGVTRPSETRVLGDWGSTRLRLFLEVDGQIVGQTAGPGIAALDGAVSGALSSALAPWSSAHRVSSVNLCGMVGARKGLVEVAYVSTPTDADSWARHVYRGKVDGIELTIAPGVQTLNASQAPDVMRGEETQIFGALELNPQLQRGRSVLVLPGTHSKWVELQDGRIQQFHTFMTGELFALLSKHSSLLQVAGAALAATPDGVASAGLPSVAPGGPGAGHRSPAEGHRNPAALNDEGFTAGLQRAARAGLGASLFETRSAQLIQGRGDEWARGYLSGLLIGSEVRSAQALGLAEDRGSVSMIGDASLCAAYSQAFAASQIDARAFDGEQCAIAGLRLLSRLTSKGS